MIKDWKPPAGIVGWQCLFLPTGLHSNSIDTERPPPGNSSISRCEPWNRCSTLPLLKCLRLEDNFSQVFFGKKKTYSSDNFDFSAISSIFILSKKSLQAPPSIKRKKTNFKHKIQFELIFIVLELTLSDWWINLHVLATTPRAVPGKRPITHSAHCPQNFNCPPIAQCISFYNTILQIWNEWSRLSLQMADLLRMESREAQLETNLEPLVLQFREPSTVFLPSTHVLMIFNDIQRSSHWLFPACNSPSHNRGGWELTGWITPESQKIIRGRSNWIIPRKSLPVWGWALRVLDWQQPWNPAMAANQPGEANPASGPLCGPQWGDGGAAG